MQTTFLELHDSAMNCLSKNPEIAAVGFGSNLKDLTERFLGLAKGALGSSEGAESGDEDAEGESINEEENGNARSKRRRSRDDGSPGSGGMQGNGGGSVPSYGGYQVSYSRENGNGRGSRSSYDNSGSQNRSAGGGSGRNNTMTTNSPLSSNFHDRELDLYSSSAQEGRPAGGRSQSPSEVLSPSTQYRQHIPTGLDGFSYSFHETNFSRRLHRAGLEHAHFMLSSPNVDQYEVARVFAYTFCYVSKEDALKTISRLLQANSNESLDINDRPEYLQLPRKPMDYTEMLQRYENDKAAKGSQFEPRDKDDFNLKEEASKMLVKLGIHQKYLRPDEVEQYIMDLGILTSTDTSVVDPDLMDMEVEPSNSRQESRTPSPAAMAPRSPPATPVRSPQRPAQAADPNQQGGFTSATVMSFEYPSQSLPAPEDQIRYQLTHFEDHTPPATRDEVNTESPTKVLEGVKKYVDLDMFVKRMLSPCLRTRDVC